MKHQLPGSVKGPTPKGIATCASCGLKAKRAGKPAKTVTLYLPDAGRGAQPFCLSNRSTSDIHIPHGPLILPGQTITTNVGKNYQWNFSNPVASTDRGDVDCFVIAH